MPLPMILTQLMSLSVSLVPFPLLQDASSSLIGSTFLFPMAPTGNDDNHAHARIPGCPFSQLGLANCFQDSVCFFEWGLSLAWLQGPLWALLLHFSDPTVPLGIFAFENVFPFAAFCRTPNCAILIHHRMSAARTKKHKLIPTTEN